MTAFSTILDNTLLTNEKLASMRLSAQGWEANFVDPELASVPSIYFYVWDKPTGWAWMCSVPLESFKLTHELANARPELKPVLCGLLAGTIADVADRTFTPQPGFTMERQLGILLPAYAALTSSMNSAIEAGASPIHMIFISYRNDERTDGWLRPLIYAGGSNEVMPVDMFNAGIKDAMAIDASIHLEWFRS